MTEPLRVVSIGGGQVIGAAQRLKKYTRPQRDSPWIDLTAVVTVTDDGGSSGRLRREFEVLRPAIFGTAWWHCPRMKHCYPGSFNTGFQRGAV